MTSSIIRIAKKMPRFSRVTRKGLPTPIKITTVAQSKTAANKVAGKLEREIKQKEEVLLYALEQPEDNLICLGWATVRPVKREVYKELEEFANEELEMSLKLFIEENKLHFVLN